MKLELAAGLDDLFQALVDVESVSGHEAGLADAVEAALAEAPHLVVSRLGDTVMARTELGRGQRVVLAGHLDTVPVADNLPSRWTDEGGRPTLWGRGSVDMKGGLAVQLSLAASLAEPRFDLTWLFYDQEEVEASRNGLGRLARADPTALLGDMAVLLEPTAARIEAGCQGTLRVALRTAGAAAHTARSWLGHNAIHDLARALVILQTFQPPRISVDGLEYREGLNAVRVAGGKTNNIVPDQAELVVNYRFAPDKTVAQATDVLEALFGGYELVVLDAAEPAPPGLDQPLAAELVAASGAEPAPKLGWTDVARFAALGLPAVNFGPGDPELAHRPDERCPLDDLVVCRRVLADWLA
ncbi:MAG: succinyl-diaminopimelate desuccinylase [Propionibacteriaceae bacterium]|nr:succinyl-diaminopimelate desuccinylase [Propionibacteriaceae bacterium]